MSLRVVLLDLAVNNSRHRSCAKDWLRSSGSIGEAWVISKLTLTSIIQDSPIAVPERNSSLEFFYSAKASEKIPRDWVLISIKERQGANK